MRVQLYLLFFHTIPVRNRLVPVHFGYPRLTDGAFVDKATRQKSDLMRPSRKRDKEKEREGGEKERERGANCKKRGVLKQRRIMKIVRCYKKHYKKEIAASRN